MSNNNWSAKFIDMKLSIVRQNGNVMFDSFWIVKSETFTIVMCEIFLLMRQLKRRICFIDLKKEEKTNTKHEIWHFYTCVQQIKRENFYTAFT